MKNIQNHRKLAALVMLIQASISAYAAEGRWIQGSWVNVRTASSPKADIAGRLTVNTPVTLFSQQGDWCEINSKSPELRGYVACSMLGSQTVSLEEIGTPLLAQGKPNPRYSATRAFWLAPSVVRLRAAGDHFWNTMLSENQKSKERPRTYDNKGNPTDFNWDKKPSPIRYAIPEYEAMKDLLKRGIVAAPELKPVLTGWSELQDAAKTSQNGEIRLANRWLDNGASTMVKMGRLSTVKPSLFKQKSDLAPAGSTTEQLSAQFGIIERIKILSGPKWVFFRNDEPMVSGNWDIGSFEISLDKPIIEYTIGRKGLGAAKEWAATVSFDVTAEPGCSDAFALRPKEGKPLPGYPSIKDPLVWVYVAQPLAFKKTAVITTAKRLPVPKDQNSSPYGTPSMLFMHEIDIDGDGIADLAVWEGMQRDGSGGDVLGTRIVFANINGEWFLLDTDQISECS